MSQVENEPDSSKSMSSNSIDTQNSDANLQSKILMSSTELSKESSNRSILKDHNEENIGINSSQTSHEATPTNQIHSSMYTSDAIEISTASFPVDGNRDSNLIDHSKLSTSSEKSQPSVQQKVTLKQFSQNVVATSLEQNNIVSSDVENILKVTGEKILQINALLDEVRNEPREDVNQNIDREKTTSHNDQDSIKRFKTENVYVMGWGEGTESEFSDYQSINSSVNKAEGKSSKEAEIYQDFPEDPVRLSFAKEKAVEKTSNEHTEMKVEEELDSRRPWRKAPMEVSVVINETTSDAGSVDTETFKLDGDRANVNREEELSVLNLKLETVAEDQQISEADDIFKQNNWMNKQIAKNDKEDLMSSSDITEIVVAKDALLQSDTALEGIQKSQPLPVYQNSVELRKPAHPSMSNDPSSPDLMNLDDINIRNSLSHEQASSSLGEEVHGLSERIWASFPLLNHQPYMQNNKTIDNTQAVAQSEESLMSNLDRHSDKDSIEKAYDSDGNSITKSIKSQRSSSHNSKNNDETLKLHDNLTDEKVAPDSISEPLIPIAPERDNRDVFMESAASGGLGIVSNVDELRNPRIFESGRGKHYQRFVPEMPRVDEVDSANSSTNTEQQELLDSKHNGRQMDRAEERRKMYEAFMDLEEEENQGSGRLSSISKLLSDRTVPTGNLSKSKSSTSLSSQSSAKNLVDRVFRNHSLRHRTGFERRFPQFWRYRKGLIVAILAATVVIIVGIVVLQLLPSNSDSTENNESLGDDKDDTIPLDPKYSNQTTLPTMGPSMTDSISTTLWPTPHDPFSWNNRTENESFEGSNPKTAIPSHHLSQVPTLSQIDNYSKITSIPTPSTALSYINQNESSPLDESTSNDTSPYRFKKQFPTTSPINTFPMDMHCNFDEMNVRYPSFSQSKLITLNTNSSWNKRGEIFGEEAYSFAGSSISLSSDGTTVAVGYRQGTGHKDRSGLIRIFKNVDLSWSQIGQDILGDNSGDNFGFALSLSGGGNFVVIGAKNGVNKGGHDTGFTRVYQFIKASNKWVQLGSTIYGKNAGDFAGHSVAISGSGKWISVSSIYSDTDEKVDAGSVRIYEYDCYIDQWTQVGNSIDGSEAFALAGFSISMSYDGTQIAIGTVHSSNNQIQHMSGHVEVYEFKTTNNFKRWVRMGSKIQGQYTLDQLGFSVSLSHDGNRIAIGANGHDVGQARNAGYCRVFDFDWNKVEWHQVGSDINGEQSGEQSGWSVSLSKTGEFLSCGGKNKFVDGVRSGYARIFYNSGDDWVQIGEDIVGPPGSSLGFATSFSYNGTYIAIGGPDFEGSYGLYEGLVHIYGISYLS